MKENQKNEIQKQEIKNQQTKRRKSLREKGITLIALVVTIIILLILAGVTLNIALSDNGLFEKAKGGAEKYKEAAKNESDIVDELDKTIDELIGGTEVADRTGLEIGDTVNYTYDDAEAYSLAGKNSGYGEYEERIYKLTKEKDQLIEQVKDATWQVLSINDDGSVDLVCTSIARDGKLKASGSDITEANAHGAVAFGGAIGYTNGVYYLNDICAEQYSNKKLGVTARNIKFEDIEKHLNEEGKAAKQQSIEKAGTKEHTDEGAYYPKLYAYENGSKIDEKEVTKDGIGSSESELSSDLNIQIPIRHSETEEGYEKAKSKLTGDSDMDVLQTGQKEFFDNSKIDEILFGTNSIFWVASRLKVNSESSFAFGIRGVTMNILMPNYLFYSKTLSSSAVAFICPVVTLGSSIQLVENVDGTWDIQNN